MADGDFCKSESELNSIKHEEAREIGEKMVDEVISLAEQADVLKEHDVIDEEEAAAKKLKEELESELEENDGWVKILGNDELMKKVIKKGEPHINPVRGDICTVKIQGKLANDESIVFQDECVKLQLGDSEVIPGLDLSIPLMTKGEVAIIKVSQRFGFGSRGLLPLVPPSANLIFQVELIDSEPEKEVGELTVAERRDIGNKKRERGNWWIKRDEISLAVQCYRRALEYLDEVEGGLQFPTGDSNVKKEEMTPELHELFQDRIKTLNNMAQAQIKLQCFEAALTSVESVLRCEPDNVKALFRKAKILSHRRDTEQALQVLHRVQQLEPSDKAVAAEITALTQRKQKEHQSEKQLYKRMFKDSSEPNDSKTENKSTGGSSFKSTFTMGLALSGLAIAVAGVMAYRYRLV